MTSPIPATSKKPNQGQKQGQNQDAVQGEGDYKSAEAYGKSVRSFAQSGKVEEAASKAKPATPQEQEELLNAERAGVSHSKGEDPASPRAPARSSSGKS